MKTVMKFELSITRLGYMADKYWSNTDVILVQLRPLFANSGRYFTYADICNMILREI